MEKLKAGALALIIAIVSIVTLLTMGYEFFPFVVLVGLALVWGVAYTMYGPKEETYSLAEYARRCKLNESLQREKTSVRRKLVDSIFGFDEEEDALIY